jgi:hypothetical protein
MDAWLAEMKGRRKETASCQKGTKANPGKMEEYPDEMKCVILHEEVSKEEAVVKIFGALKKLYGDRHLAVGRRGEPKEQTRGNCGSLLQKDDPQCRSGTAQGKCRKEKSNQVQCGIRSLERMDISRNREAAMT